RSPSSRRALRGGGGGGHWGGGRWGLTEIRGKPRGGRGGGARPRSRDVWASEDATGPASAPMPNPRGENSPAEREKPSTSSAPMMVARKIPQSPLRRLPPSAGCAHRR